MTQTVDDLVRIALTTFADSDVGCPYARERELVSWFVIGHLLPLARPESILKSPLQVGIEVAVPQHRSPSNPRKDPDVCKDVVIWPRPLMVCWNDAGKPQHYPLAIIEWKSICRRDPKGLRDKKRRDFRDHDLPWLQKTAETSAAFVGYGVFADVSTGRINLRCTRSASSTTDVNWLVIGDSAPAI